MKMTHEEFGIQVFDAEIAKHGNAWSAARAALKATITAVRDRCARVADKAASHADYQFMVCANNLESDLGVKDEIEKAVKYWAGRRDLCRSIAKEIRDTEGE